jgi:glyoxylase-like metal-dependent hydrolase (beta-lactamase superfamily II)
MQMNQTEEKYMSHRIKLVLWTSCVLIFSLSAAVSIGYGQGSPEVDVRRLSERAIVLKVQGGNSNIIALKTDKGIVVFDTDVSPALAQLIRTRIEMEFKHNQFAYVINTHGHGDHTNGNTVFPEAKIIGHANVSAEMDKTAEQTPRTITAIRAGLERFDAAIAAGKDPKQVESLKLRKAYYETMLAGLEEGRPLRYPDITITDNKILEIGDLTLKLIPFGPAHSRSDIVIHCPEEGLWITGDLFFEGNDLYIDSERVPHLGHWMEVMEEITDTREKTKFIVPGHDDIMSIDVIGKALESVKSRMSDFAGKESAFLLFKKYIESDGPDIALQKLKDMKNQAGKYYALHSEIDQYAYGLMLDDKLDEALAVFQVLAELFPDISMAFDSLGEVYMRKDDKENAVRSFEKSLELDPENRNARRRLEELKK